MAACDCWLVCSRLWKRNDDSIQSEVSGVIREKLSHAASQLTEIEKVIESLEDIDPTITCDAIDSQKMKQDTSSCPSLSDKAAATQEEEVPRSVACLLEKENIEPYQTAQEGDYVCSRSGADVIDIEVGDFVLLGHGAPQEYRSCHGVVKKVAETHCTVVVLDSTCSQGVGECWPDFADVAVESKALRIGRRVVVEGMRGNRFKHLNGLTGTISRHPREGHPTFVKKSARLTVCVVFDSPGVSFKLMEPRFLTSYDSILEQETKALQEVFHSLRTPRGDPSEMDTPDISPSISPHSSPRRQQS
jgi:hypothetical protein